MLNRVGSRFLELIDGRRTVEDLIDSMFEEFEVDRESLTQDVEAFVWELSEAGVIEEVGKPVSREPG